MSEDGLYRNTYAEFFKNQDKAKGYEFEHAPPGNVPPPAVTFAEKLQWWSRGRWKRLKKIQAERDRHVQEIVRIGRSNTPQSK